MSVNQLEELSSEFERELTRAMRGVDPAEGFADRVMARAQVNAKPRVRLFGMPLRARVWTSGAIAAALLTGIFIGEEIHLRHQREEAAQQQFELAMRITDRTLEHVQQQLWDAGVRLGN
jgi:hypothetical protein